MKNLSIAAILTLSLSSCSWFGYGEDDEIGAWQDYTLATQPRNPVNKPTDMPAVPVQPVSTGEVLPNTGGPDVYVNNNVGLGDAVAANPLNVAPEQPQFATEYPLPAEPAPLPPQPVTTTYNSPVYTAPAAAPTGPITPAAYEATDDRRAIYNDSRVPESLKPTYDNPLNKLNAPAYIPASPSYAPVPPIAVPPAGAPAPLVQQPGVVAPMFEPATAPAPTQPVSGIEVQSGNNQ